MKTVIIIATVVLTIAAVAGGVLYFLARYLPLD